MGAVGEVVDVLGSEFDVGVAGGRERGGCWEEVEGGGCDDDFYSIGDDLLVRVTKDCC